MPSYDLSEPNRVKVTVYGKILDQNYTRLLNADRDLDINTVFLLDKIQKKEQIPQAEYRKLKKAGLAEGRYPNFFVSYKIAEAVGQPESYIRNAGLDDEMCKAYILKALRKTGPVKKAMLLSMVEKAFPDVLSDEQKNKKLSNLLQVMKTKDKTVDSEGNTRGTVWFVRE